MRGLRAKVAVAGLLGLALALVAGCGDLYYSLFTPEPEYDDIEQVFFALRNSWKEVTPLSADRLGASERSTGAATSTDGKVSITLSTEMENEFTVSVARFQIRDYADTETGITVEEVDFTSKAREYVDFNMRRNLEGTAKVKNAGTVRYVRFDIGDSYGSWGIYDYFDPSAFSSAKYHYIWGELYANGRKIDQWFVELPAFPAN